MGWAHRRRVGAVSVARGVVLAGVLAFVGGCGSVPQATQVTITGVTAAHRLQPGTTALIALSATSLPLAGTIDITKTQIIFASASGAAMSAVPTAIVAGSGTSVVLTFAVPSVTVTTATAYSVTVSGTTTRGQSFTAAAAFSVTVSPGAMITGLMPAAGTVGQTVSVAITAMNSDFVQGTTQANFGAGISVNGAGQGMPANITVTGAGAGTASLVIDPAAVVGTRDVTVSTGDQTAVLKAGFAVQAVLLPLKAAAGGPYKGVAGQVVTFDGSGSSDPNGAALSYAWTFGDGGTGTGVAPAHTYAKAGSYPVALTVSDANGLTAASTTSVAITALVNPVAVAGGPYTGTMGVAVAFDGSGSTDANASALTYVWSFGDGGTGAGAKPTHAYASAGTFRATLTVTDTFGLTAMANATVTVTAAAAKPVASAGGPYSGSAGAAIAFDGSGSADANGLPLIYAWDFGDGTVGSGVQPAHSYSAAGSYTVRLTVSDSSGLSGTASATAVVAAARMLTANAGGPYSGVIGAAVTFSGAGSADPKGEALTYAWSFGDGGTGTGVAPAHSYAAAWTFTVGLTVTNVDGVTASASTTAVVTAVAVPVAAVITAGSATGNVGQMISFDGSGSTAPGTDALTYTWNFGDGAAGMGAAVSHAYAAAGSYTVTLTVADGAVVASVTTSVAITQPLAVTITAPAQGALFNTTSVTVTGMADAAAQSVTVNGVAATLASGAFSAAVPVREGVNVITATATATNGNVGTASTSVAIDLTAPLLSIFQPVDQSSSTTQQINVAGMITDQVTGTVNANDVTVTVNGQAATVANRSFLLTGLVLVPGANALTVVATDKAGNVSRSAVHVTLAPSTTQQHIAILGGNNQTGTIGSVLPQALQVQMQTANGTPVPNRAVTFTVTASDGVVESLPQQAQTLSLQTDATGKASVLFQLGTRAGLGINQVSVTSPGFAGAAVFTESTTPGAPAFIHEFLGNNQRGILGQPVAQNLQTIVQDTGGNPIAGVPVVFTILGGDGSVGVGTSAAQTTYTVSTNSDGRAQATLTLGQQQGINNNLVTADFAGDPNSPVTFYASGYSSGAASATSVSGVVLDNAGAPVPNATASLLGTNLSTTTDANGHFMLSGTPVGTVTLLVDGSTTTLAETLPSLSFLLQDLPGQNNTLNMPVYLPIVDTSSAQTAGGNTPVTLALKGMAGAGITIAPNSVTFPDGSHVGQLTLSQVKSDLIPMPPPNGIPPAFAWTIQPAGTRFSTPATITIPNTQGLAPGTVEEFYQYDHDLEQFVSVGTIRVSPDGSVLNSDPGFGITKAGWSSPGGAPPPGVCAITCDDGNPCTKDSKNPKTCQCDHEKLSQGGCGNNSKGRDACVLPGFCRNGVCDSGHLADGAGCDSGKKCEMMDVCKGGVCKGTKIPDKVSDPSGAGIALSANWTQLTNALQNRLQISLNGLKISASFTPGLEGKKQCCEKMNGMMTSYLAGSLKASAAVTSGPITYPLPIPGLRIGPYIQPTLTGSLGFTVSYDGCNAPKDVLGLTGMGGLDLTIEGGLITEFINPLTGAEVGLKADIKSGDFINVWADAEAQHMQFGLDAVTANLTFTYLDGSSTGGTVMLLPAVPLGGAINVTNPAPPQ